MSYPLVEALEKLARANIEALNNRDFSPTSPIWHKKLSSWTARAEDASDFQALGLPAFIESIQRFLSIYPTFQIRIVDMSTSVDEKNGFAEVFMNIETTGNPPGLFKRSVTTILYQKVQGEWLSARHVAMPGMVQDGP